MASLHSDQRQGIILHEGSFGQTNITQIVRCGAHELKLVSGLLESSNRWTRNRKAVKTSFLKTQVANRLEI